MRNDMKKLLCLRPRIKEQAGEKGVKKRIQKGMRGDYEDWDLPQKEAMKSRQYKDHKMLNEYLQPLIRYLRSNVGEKWDDVYSEIKKACPNDSAVNAHIYQHLFDFVEVKPQYDENGNPIKAEQFGWKKEGPDYIIDRGQDQNFYVDEQGILRRAPYIKRSRGRKLQLHEQYPDCWINGNFFTKIDDVWYEAEFRPLPKPRMETEPRRWGSICKWIIRAEDVLFMKRGWRTSSVVFSSPHVLNHHKDAKFRKSDFEEYYGKKVYCSNLRQINSREKKKLGLK